MFEFQLITHRIELYESALIGPVMRRDRRRNPSNGRYTFPQERMATGMFPARGRIGISEQISVAIPGRGAAQKNSARNHRQRTKNHGQTRGRETASRSTDVTTARRWFLSSSFFVIFHAAQATRRRKPRRGRQDAEFLSRGKNVRIYNRCRGRYLQYPAPRDRNRAAGE